MSTPSSIPPRPEPNLSGHCDYCERSLDRLRAERVAVFEWRFRYFCCAACEQSYREHPPHAPTPTPSAISPSPSPTRVNGFPGLAALEKGDGNDTATQQGTHAAVERLSRLQALALVLCALQLFLTLPAPGALVHYVRVGLAVSAAAALLVQYRHRPRTDLDLPPALLLAPPVLLTLALLVSAACGSPEQGLLATTAALVLGASVASDWLMQRARRPSEQRLTTLQQHLSLPARRLLGDETVLTPAHDMRPGQEVFLAEGDFLVVDVTLTAGSVQVEPWPTAGYSEERREGQSLVAGATVTLGTARAVVTWAGHDRALLRALLAPDRAAQVHGAASRWSNLAATRIAPALATLVGISSFTLGTSPARSIVLWAVTLLWLSNPVYRAAAGLLLRRTVLRALHKGIAYHDAGCLDRAGRVTAAVLCSRSAVLLGTPEVVVVEGFADHSVEDVFSLAAGALEPATHPNAVALRRAALARGIGVDAVRSHDLLPGLGVSAVASGGQPLCVGNRALMLKNRISIAAAEQRIHELEASGRTVLLVALGEHLVGFVGLQDGLRRGARGAVQRLHAAGIEPILLSGDSRETCERVGKAIGLHHIRPEVLPADRAKEIQRLSDTGAVVAVIGQSPVDDSALGAADVSVALGTAGSTASGFSVDLASDHVQDAALALTLARTARSASIRLLWALTAPGALGCLLGLLGFPPELAMVLVLLGMLLGLNELRRSDSLQPPHSEH